VTTYKRCQSNLGWIQVTVARPREASMSGLVYCSRPCRGCDVRNAPKAKCECLGENDISLNFASPPSNSKCYMPPGELNEATTFFPSVLVSLDPIKRESLVILPSTSSPSIHPAIQPHPPPMYDPPTNNPSASMWPQCSGTQRYDYK
jgi:hypothetical protein